MSERENGGAERGEGTAATDDGDVAKTAADGGDLPLPPLARSTPLRRRMGKKESRFDKKARKRGRAL